MVHGIHSWMLVLCIFNYKILVPRRVRERSGLEDLCRIRIVEFIETSDARIAGNSEMCVFSWKMCHCVPSMVYRFKQSRSENLRKRRLCVGV